MEELRTYNHLASCKTKIADELANLEKKFSIEYVNLKIVKETKENVCEGIKFFEKQIYLVESLQNKSFCWPPETRTYFELGNIFVLYDRPSFQNLMQSKINELTHFLKTFQDTLQRVEKRLQEYNTFLQLVLDKTNDKKETIKALDEDLNDLEERRMMKRNKKRRG